MLFQQTLFLLISFFSIAVLGDNLGTGGIATRYWDCCRPSGSYSGKAAVNQPVRACKKDGVTQNTNQNAQSGCQGGDSFSCNNYQPYVSSVSTLSYAFGARAQSNGEDSFECACYALKFNQLAGKTLVVQATNTGGDVPPTNFDIQIPGGGVGLFNGCSSQFNAGTSGWGAQYGGLSNRNDCAVLPSAIRAGCYWRFDWFADNPTISSIKRVKCPTTLTDKSKCIRNDDNQYPAAPTK